MGVGGRCNQTVPRNPPNTPAPPTPAPAQAARRRPAPPIPNTRGSASPQGEARRECAGKAEQSDRRAREDYGWGWAGGVTKPNHPPHPSTRPPNTRGSPSRTAPPAPPTPAAAQAAQRATRPPNTRGSTSRTAPPPPTVRRHLWRRTRGNRRQEDLLRIDFYTGERLGMGSTAIGSSLAAGRLMELGASGSQSRARPSRAVLRSRG